MTAIHGQGDPREWSSAVRAERAMCFADYSAALDREGCAADAYAESVRRLSRFLWRSA